MVVELGDRIPDVFHGFQYSLAGSEIDAHRFHSVLATTANRWAARA
jgi:hypothetical protein